MTEHREPGGVLDETFDFRRFDDIGSPEFVGELAQIFVHDIATRLEDLALALAAREDQALERQAHAVRGACSNFGARRMAALAERIERAPNCHSKSTAAVLDALRAEFELVQRALKTHLG
jgi:HPt (histidine-containing phosphotransfer) domain-containing protein